MFQPTMTIVTL